MSSERDAEVVSIVTVLNICSITMFCRLRDDVMFQGNIICDVHQWTSPVWIMSYLVVLRLILQKPLYRIKK